MIYSGKLLRAELFDDHAPPYTDVRAPDARGPRARKLSLDPARPRGGSAQCYDGSTRIKGDGRTIYSYLLLWFEEEKEVVTTPDTKFKKGIDVSQWQGDIDWAAVKAAGVEFAMLRAGYGQGNVDPKFGRNASECERLGIPFGIYWFSYAYTPEMAAKEALYALEAVRPY